MIRDKLRIIAGISGGGTTFREIYRATKDGRLPSAEIAGLIASTESAGGIKKALDDGLGPQRITVLDPTKFDIPTRFGEAILKYIDDCSGNLWGQFGWLPLTPNQVVEKMKAWSINQHPGPLDPDRPEFHFGGHGMYGRRVHCARLYFLRRAQRPLHDWWTEATAQRVAKKFDQGAILRRERVPIEKYDDPISLQERVLPIEHRVQIETIRDFCENRVTELKRDDILVRDDESAILQEAMYAARTIFPKG